MVSGKRVLCAHCGEKCSGSVLRFQDQYYHKPCFKLYQEKSASSSGPESLTNSNNNSNNNKTTETNTKSVTNKKKIEETSKNKDNKAKAKTLDSKQQQQLTTSSPSPISGKKTSTLPNRSKSTVEKGSFISNSNSQSNNNNNNNGLPTITNCAHCKEKILDGQALIALDLHWHVWCFKCCHCDCPLMGEYVAKEGKAYCEKDYQKLFGIICVYCKRYITGKVLQAGEQHHFHPSCARCAKCGDSFVPGEEMYLQSEVIWHPRCGPLVIGTLRKDASSYLDHQPARAHSPSMSSGGTASPPPPQPPTISTSPYADYQARQSNWNYHGTASEQQRLAPLGDLSRIYTISYLHQTAPGAHSNQAAAYLRRPLDAYPPKSPSQFSRPSSLSRLGAANQSTCSGSYLDRFRCYSRSQQQQPVIYTPSSRRGMQSVLSGAGGGASSRATSAGCIGRLQQQRRRRPRSPCMMNEEAIQMAAYPSGQPPDSNSVPNIERDDFPAPPFSPQRRRRRPHERGHHHHHQQQRGQSTSNLSSQSVGVAAGHDDDDDHDAGDSSSQNMAPMPQPPPPPPPRPVERASRPRSRDFANTAAAAAAATSTPSTMMTDKQQQKLNVTTTKSSMATRRHRSSTSFQSLASSCSSCSLSSSLSQEDNEQQPQDNNNSPNIGPQFRKEERELSKIANGIGRVFLKTLRQREKLHAWKRANLEPRNASRTPSATRELPASRPLRYDNPTNASLSHRDLISSTATSTATSTINASTYSRLEPTRVMVTPPINDSQKYTNELNHSSVDGCVSAATLGGDSQYSSQSTPSSSLASRTLIISSNNNNTDNDSHNLDHHRYKVHSRPPTTTEHQRLNRMGSAAAAAASAKQQKQQFLYGFNRSLWSNSSGAHLRRSMPNVAHSSRDSFSYSSANWHSQYHRDLGQPPKLYPYHLLATTNYRLPADVDRCHLERHLANEEFQFIFNCDRIDFYRMPEWKRNDLKRRAKLF